ncbi:MAG: hypothetical protein RIB67_08835 [Miltoncostaeaceae bacterium]
MLLTAHGAGRVVRGPIIGTVVTAAAMPRHPTAQEERDEMAETPVPMVVASEGEAAARGVADPVGKDLDAE